MYSFWNTLFGNSKHSFLVLATKNQLYADYLCGIYRQYDCNPTNKCNTNKTDRSLKVELFSDKNITHGISIKGPKSDAVAFVNMLQQCHHIEKSCIPGTSEVVSDFLQSQQNHSMNHSALIKKTS